MQPFRMDFERSQDHQTLAVGVVGQSDAGLQAAEHHKTVRIYADSYQVLISNYC